MPHGEGNRAVVIGGGLAGLSAAACLCEAGWRVTVLEREDRPGGRCRTERVGGFLFDTGAQHFHDSFDGTLSAAIRNGLGAGLRIPLEKKAIVRRGKLVDFAPRNLSPFGLLPWKTMGPAGIVNAAGAGARLVANYRAYNPGLPLKRARGDDERAVDFLSRRTTETFRCGFAEPVSVYATGADLRDISAAAFMIALRYTFGDRTGCFTGGMGSLTEALSDRAELITGMEASGVIFEGSKAAGVRAAPVDGGRARIFEADAVVCALPATRVAGVVGRLGEAAARLAAATEYAAALTVNFAVESRPAPGGPVLLPVSEGFTASWACTSASKAAEHAPEGCSVLTAVFCGAGAERLAGEPDDAVLDAAAADLERCYRTGGIHPVASRVFRHVEGRPVPGPGHGALADAARLEGSGAARLALAGDWTTAPTVEGAVSSGEWAARSLLAECEREQ